jgi:tetratricopeptide (TPR) repeat protein
MSRLSHRSAARLPDLPDLPAAAWDRVERILERFEDAWQHGDRPALEDYLAGFEAERRALLIELVHEDLEFRLQAGEPARVETYLERYPELAVDRARVLSLITEEYALRLQYERDCSPTEYGKRFPDYAEALAARLPNPPAASLAPPAATSDNADTVPPQPGPAPSESTPPAPPAPQSPSSELTAEVAIPGYQILGELGRGGMGVVYRARQTSLDRLVALKMVLAGVHAGPDERARFRREAEAVARLQHPNIVQIHEVGEHDGTPFFSLEYVPGGSLDRKINGTPLPSRQAAQLAETLAQGVAAAHEQSIIHRDLKPANVLLTADGQPKITDFGLAKRLEGEPGALATGAHTQTGAIIGTPSYMAPEQAGGSSKAIGPPADIYALGAILYELVTGRPPFRGETTLDTLRQVANDEPVPPSRLNPRLPRDLETICLKCLQKQALKRYATAKDLAADLRRFQAGEPIVARPVGRFEKASKWVRRNRGLSAGLAAALLALVVGLSVSLWQMFRAIDAEADAITNADQASIKAQEARRNAQQARNERDAKGRALAAEQKARQRAFAALRSMTEKVVEGKFARSTALTEDDRAYFRDVIEQFDAFAAIKGDDADSREMRAEGRLRVGTIRTRLGELKEAEKDYDRALSIYRQLAADFPNRPGLRHMLAMSHHNRAGLLSRVGRLEEAEKDINQALSIFKQLAARFPTRPEFRVRLAMSHTDLGNLLPGPGRRPDAEKNYNQALRILKQLAADFPKRPEFTDELARSHQHRGELLQAMGRLEEAQKDYDQALFICRQLAARFGRHESVRKLAISHSLRGHLLSQTGRLQDAEKDFDQAVSLGRQLAAEFPSLPELSQLQARNLKDRGNLLHEMGRLQLAEKDHGQALSIQKQLAADFPNRPEFREDLAGSHQNRGSLLHAAGRLKEAEKDCYQAVRIYKQLVAAFPARPGLRRSLAQSHNNRGNLLRDIGRLKEAEKDYDQALRIHKQLAAEFHFQPAFRQELASIHFNRGRLLHDTGRLKQAQMDYDQALRIQKQLTADFPNQHQFRKELAGSHNQRGLLLSDRGRPKEAEKDYGQALSIQKQLAADFPNQPDRRNDLAGTFVNLGVLHLQQENWAAAKRLLLDGQPHHRAALNASPRHPGYRQFYRNHLGALTAAYAGLLEQEDAVRTAETWRNLGWNAPADAYDAACILSRCIYIVAQHNKLDNRHRKEAAQFYGDAAMKLLRDAVSKGFNDVVHMKKETDLDPLRQREDFQKLITELEGKME